MWNNQFIRGSGYEHINYAMTNSDSFVEVRTTNVKGHFTVSTPITIPEILQSQVKHHGNFWTVRLHHLTSLTPISSQKLVYVVFPTCGHVNVSGIKDFNECDIAKLEFERLFDVRALSAFNIDNSTSCGKLPFASLDLLKLYSLVVSGQGPAFPCTISIRPHYFPSVLLRPKHCHQISTSILFTNGKFIVIGAKSPAQTARTVHNLQQLVYASL